MSSNAAKPINFHFLLNRGKEIPAALFQKLDGIIREEFPKIINTEKVAFDINNPRNFKELASQAKTASKKTQADELHVPVVIAGANPDKANNHRSKSHQLATDLQGCAAETGRNVHHLIARKGGGAQFNYRVDEMYRTGMQNAKVRGKTIRDDSFKLIPQIDIDSDKVALHSMQNFLRAVVVDTARVHDKTEVFNGDFKFEDSRLKKDRDQIAQLQSNTRSQYPGDEANAVDRFVNKAANLSRSLSTGLGFQQTSRVDHIFDFLSRLSELQNGIGTFIARLKGDEESTAGKFIERKARKPETIKAGATEQYWSLVDSERMDTKTAYGQFISAAGLANMPKAGNFALARNMDMIEALEKLARGQPLKTALGKDPAPSDLRKLLLAALSTSTETATASQRVYVGNPDEGAPFYDVGISNWLRRPNNFNALLNAMALHCGRVEKPDEEAAPQKKAAKKKPAETDEQQRVLTREELTALVIDLRRNQSSTDISDFYHRLKRETKLGFDEAQLNTLEKFLCLRLNRKRDADDEVVAHIDKYKSISAASEALAKEGQLKIISFRQLVEGQIAKKFDDIELATIALFLGLEVESLMAAEATATNPPSNVSAEDLDAPAVPEDLSTRVSADNLARIEAQLEASPGYGLHANSAIHRKELPELLDTVYKTFPRGMKAKQTDLQALILSHIDKATISLTAVRAFATTFDIELGSREEPGAAIRGSTKDGRQSGTGRTKLTAKADVWDSAAPTTKLEKLLEVSFADVCEQVGANPATDLSQTMIPGIGATVQYLADDTMDAVPTNSLLEGVEITPEVKAALIASALRQGGGSIVERTLKAPGNFDRLVRRLKEA